MASSLTQSASSITKQPVFSLWHNFYDQTFRQQDLTKKVLNQSTYAKSIHHHYHTYQTYTQHRLLTIQESFLAVVCAPNMPHIIISPWTGKTRTFDNRSKLMYPECFLDQNVTFCTYLTSNIRTLTTKVHCILIYVVFSSKYCK